MRHMCGNKKLGLPTDQRMALIKNGAKALFQYKQIKTTKHRAKQIQSYVEIVITKALANNLHSRREVFKMIPDSKIMKLIFQDDFLSKYQNQKGGYTRILKLGIRRGDAASVSVLELI